MSCMGSGALFQLRDASWSCVWSGTGVPASRRDRKWYFVNDSGGYGTVLRCDLFSSFFSLRIHNSINACSSGGCFNVIGKHEFTNLTLAGHVRCCGKSEKRKQRLEIRQDVEACNQTAQGTRNAHGPDRRILDSSGNDGRKFARIDSERTSVIQQDPRLAGLSGIKIRAGVRERRISDIPATQEKGHNVSTMQFDQINSGLGSTESGLEKNNVTEHERAFHGSNEMSEERSNKADFRGNHKSSGMDSAATCRNSDVKTESLEEGDEFSSEQITRIPVERQRYIGISKVDLVANLQLVFVDDEDASEFLSICSCIEAILHAEHKQQLEELRSDYRLTRSSVEETRLSIKKKGANLNDNNLQCTGVMENRDQALLFDFTDTQCNKVRVLPDRHNLPESFQSNCEMDGCNLTTVKERKIALPFKFWMDPLLSYAIKVNDSDRVVTKQSSIAASIRFQLNFMQLLKNAQFQGLSTHDLQMASLLNSDYLLTLPIEVDWKQSSSSHAIIYRRGYAAERQEGYLFGAKLDYLQSLLLRKIFNMLANPLLQAGVWINQNWKQFAANEGTKFWIEGLKQWLEEPLKPDMENGLASPLGDYGFEKADTLAEGNGNDLPIWVASQQAVPRYEAFLSSVGSRGILLKRILVWMHLLPSKSLEPCATFEDCLSSSEPHLRQKHLMRVSMKEIWLPASKAISGNNVWRRIKSVFSVFFSRSTLQEPAFKELVLLHNVQKKSNTDSHGDGILNLQIKIYRNILIPDIKVIFPNKKLSFRILDMVRLDIATIVGLLAFLVNYRFEDFLSSPSAFLLDIIATSALIVYVTRVVLGYKQTWDRYQLLVNKTLHEKTLASGFGAIHYLVDASEQQKFKEAAVAYALLMQAQNNQVDSREVLAEICERFLYNCFKEQIEMPIDDAMETLLRLGLVVETKMGPISREHNNDRKTIIKGVPFAQSYKGLKERWDSLLYNHSIWSGSDR
eukprot:c27663_g1_i1 orf=578-3478(-)